jgi:hypothetical protein
MNSGLSDTSGSLNDGGLGSGASWNAPRCRGAGFAEPWQRAPGWFGPPECGAR